MQRINIAAWALRDVDGAKPLNVGEYSSARPVYDSAGEDDTWRGTPTVGIQGFMPEPE